MVPLLLSALVLVSWCSPTSAREFICDPHRRYTHPKDTRKFVLCDENRKLKIFDCPEGLHWNSTKSYCDWPKIVTEDSGNGTVSKEHAKAAAHKKTEERAKHVSLSRKVDNREESENKTSVADGPVKTGSKVEVKMVSLKTRTNVQDGKPGVPKGDEDEIKDSGEDSPVGRKYAGNEEKEIKQNSKREEKGLISKIHPISKREEKKEEAKNEEESVKHKETVVENKEMFNQTVEKEIKESSFTGVKNVTVMESPDYYEKYRQKEMESILFKQSMIDFIMNFQTDAYNAEGHRQNYYINSGSSEFIPVGLQITEDNLGYIDATNSTSENSPESDDGTTRDNVPTSENPPTDEKSPTHENTSTTEDEPTPSTTAAPTS